MGSVEKIPDHPDPRQGRRIASLQDRPAAAGALEDQLERHGAESVMPRARRVERELEIALTERAVAESVEGVSSWKHLLFPSWAGNRADMDGLVYIAVLCAMRRGQRELRNRDVDR